VCPYASLFPIVHCIVCSLCSFITNDAVRTRSRDVIILTRTLPFTHQRHTGLSHIQLFVDIHYLLEFQNDLILLNVFILQTATHHRNLLTYRSLTSSAWMKITLQMTLFTTWTTSILTQWTPLSTYVPSPTAAMRISTVTKRVCKREPRKWKYVSSRVFVCFLNT